MAIAVTHEDDGITFRRPRRGAVIRPRKQHAEAPILERQNAQLTPTGGIADPLIEDDERLRSGGAEYDAASSVRELSIRCRRNVENPDFLLPRINGLHDDEGGIVDRPITHRRQVRVLVHHFRGAAVDWHDVERSIQEVGDSRSVIGRRGCPWIERPLAGLQRLHLA
ncbi:MAG TPA: hypothetical protein VMO26_01180 [Vicinamibacterales bacterium]|nr:hypothetical protein [Vicinamibacterales bacterium]